MRKTENFSGFSFIKEITTDNLFDFDKVLFQLIESFPPFYDMLKGRTEEVPPSSPT